MENLFQYIIDDLRDPQLLNVWGVLEYIQETLNYGKPHTTIISISLDPKDYHMENRISPTQIKTILEFLQTKNILNLLKETRIDQVLNSVLVKIDKKKFESEYKSIEEDIKRRNISAIETKETKKEEPSSDNLLENLKWSEITIHFLNGEEAILKMREVRKHTTYEEMGFKNQKTNKPDTQWTLLKLLSERKGEISWENTKLSLDKTNRIKKQKQILSESLKRYFKIEEDPFYDYRKTKSYKIKINLEQEIKSSEEQEEDSSVLYEEQTPGIYEKEKHKDE